ncbi:MAG: HPr family phosphocarrier protein [Nitriliruptoraceae bacterium]|nr:HPr family phosphocarrier protein [Nitriliruptoraceae bacterium]
MASTELRITDEVGLHARPAARFVKAAAGFASTVRVTHGHRSADAKSLLEVLQLEAGNGAHIVIEATGEDEDEALRVLAEMLADAG